MPLINSFVHIDSFEGYLCHKTIFCHKVASLSCVVDEFFYLKKKLCFVLEISRFWFLWNPQITKSMTNTHWLLHNGSYTHDYFFSNLSTIKMKFDQTLVCCMTNISHMFLAQCWRLETISRPFYDFMILLKWQYS